MHGLTIAWISIYSVIKTKLMIVIDPGAYRILHNKFYWCADLLNMSRVRRGGLQR